MNGFPAPPVMMIVATIGYFVVPIASLALLAVVAVQLRSINRNIERVVRLAERGHDGEA